ncbi:transporter substrate-binding domain-containing protein [Celerinatantimonas yamalensis]|uniref:Transporter substrate-binding domain-containing protein n=1 Tax=Celerinatantimonas yamalensis TaxID=559956 RepID=A0ABW9G549_9GAMM
MRFIRMALIGILIFPSIITYASNGILRFATEASYPPFESINHQHQFTGFDIELVQALCRQMQTHCVFTNHSFDSLLASIEFGRYDAAISAIDITPERAKRVAFSAPYLTNGAVFLIHKDSFQHQYQLRKKVIAVQNGSSEQQYLLDHYVAYGAVVVPYASYQMALEDLLGGKVDSVFVDSAVALDWIKKHPAYEVLGKTVIDNDYFGAGFGIAVNQQDTELQARLNKALKAIKASGEYQKIFNQYFVEASVNATSK